MGTSSSKRAQRAKAASSPRASKAASLRASPRLSLSRKKLPAGWTDQDVALDELEAAIFAANGVARPGSDGYAFALEAGTTTARDVDAVQRVLLGQRVEAGDVSPRKTAVRVFMSSTFTDTNAERNAFLAFCVPHLRAVCRSRGLELVVSEMRWGVTEAMSNSHQTASLCMREVGRCLDESAAMQFVGILGNKYGFQPLPTSVPAPQFDDVLTAVAATGDENETAKQLLTTWYALDENAVPSAYVLLPVSDVLPGYNASVQDEVSRVWWEDNFVPLQRLFQQHSDLATLSVTEDEMLRGVQDPERCLLIVRDFDTDTDVTDRNYADDHRDALGRLRKEMVARVEPSGNVLRNDAVKWEDGGIDAVAHPQAHGKYLADVLPAWTRKMEESLASIEAPEADAQLEEAQAHWRFALAKVGSFVGRVDLVQAVGDLAASSKLVHGVSGAGKTSVLAMTAVELSSSSTSSTSSTVVIPRFLGTTVASRTVRPLLESLCDQLWRVFKEDEERPAFPEQQYDLQQAFVRTYLALATVDRPLTLILDSVDQVLDADALDWLPAASDLPLHVSLIVSVLSDDKTLLEHAQRKAYADEVPVALLRMDDVPEILSTWLSARSRTLTSSQQALILDTLQHCDKPTYLLLRVVFNEALEWRSFSPLTDWSAITSIVTAVDALLAKVEAEFGQVLATTALALLTYARDGLSDVELADLLSADNKVLEEVFEWWLPPQARVPPLLVTRLLDTLRDYFVSAGTNKWFHRQFWQTAQARYAPRKQDALNAIADYFQGTTDPQPLDMPRFKQRLGRNRQLPSQPFKLRGDSAKGGSGQHNVRKLRELPEALLATGRTDEAVALLMDVRFIIGMFSVGLHDELTYELLLDARLPKSKSGVLVDVLSDVQHVLELGRSALLNDPLELASQLQGRLEPRHPALRGVEEHYTWEGVSWLKPVRPTLELARSSLRKTLVGHGEAVVAVAHSHELDMIVSGSSDTTVKVWKASTGQLLRTLEGHSDAVMGVAVAKEARLDIIVSGGWDKTVKVWRASTGELLRTLEGHSDTVASVAVAARLDMIVSGSDDKTVKVWKASTGALLRTLEGHSRQVRSVAVDAGLDMIVSGSDDVTVKVWKASTGELLRTLEAGVVHGVAVDADLDMIVSGDEYYTVKVWKASTGELRRTLEGHSGDVNGVAVNSGLDMIVSGSNDKTIKVWKASTGQLLRTLEGHSGEVWSVAVDPERGLGGLEGLDMIVSGSDDKTVKAWKTSTAEALRTVEGHSETVWSMAVSPELDLVVSGSLDMTAKMWKASTGELLRTLEGHSSHVRCVAVVADLDMIISGSNDKTIKVWKASTGQLLRTLEGHSRAVCCLAVAPGLDMITSGSLDQTVKLWKPSTGELLRTLQVEWGNVWSVAVIPGLDMIVGGSNDETIKVWKASTGELLRTLEGHAESVQSVATDAGLDMVVSGSDDKTVKVWKASTGELLRTLEGHSAKVISVAVVPESDVIVSTDSAGNSLLWAITTGRQVLLDAVLDLSNDARSPALAHNGLYHVALTGCTVGSSTDAAIDLAAKATQDGIVAVGDVKGRVHIFKRAG